MAEPGEAAAGPPPKKTEDDTPPVEEKKKWTTIIWNSDKKEFLGRGGRSWFDITVFYLIFYGTLIAYFWASFYVALLFIDNNKPYREQPPIQWIRYGHILHETGPGLSYRPVPDRKTNPESDLIWFGTGDYEQYNFWSTQLQQWMWHSGHWQSKHYGPCNGEDPSFGYSRGEPCILIKINRIYNYLLGSFENKDALLHNDRELITRGGNEQYKLGDCPNCDEADHDVRVSHTFADYIRNSVDEEFENHHIKKHVFIWCEGLDIHDKENLGSIQYYPGPFIKIKDYEWTDPNAELTNRGKESVSKNKKVRYQTPFIMIKLFRPMPGALITIVCQLHAKHVRTNKKTQVGYVTFSILVG